jgi:single-strand DNA-binding protein
MYNKVVMAGHVTRDIELKYLPSGAAIARSAIATNFRYKSGTGEQKDETCFLDFNVFGKQAEVLNQYIRKGSKVLLEGRLVFEQWTAQDGSNRNRHSLRVDNFTFLDNKGDNQNSGGGYNNAPAYDNAPSQQGNYNNQNNNSYQQQQPQQQYNNQAPQNNMGNSQGGMNNANTHTIPEYDIDEDEIPF